MLENVSKKQGAAYSLSSLFHDWFAENSLLNDISNPFDRIGHFLHEIQRRTLSEQVILYMWNKKDKNGKIWEVSPSKEDLLISEKLITDIIKSYVYKKGLFTHRQIAENSILSVQLKQSQCNSLILETIYSHADLHFSILIINYSTVLEEKITDFLKFIFPVLSVLIQNVLLFNEIKNKDTQIREWTKNVEERIKQGTRSILEKETRYHSLFENATDGIIVFNSAGHILEVNKSACDILGYSKSDFKNMNWSEFVEDKDRHAKFIKRALNGIEIGPAQTIFINKSGAKIDAEITCKKIWYKGERVIQSFIRDISLRRILERGLRDAKEKYETLVENALVGVFILQDGRIQYLNQVFEKMTGFMRGELIGRRYSDMLKHDAQKDFNKMLKKNLNGRQFEVKFITKRGEERIGEVRLNSVVLNGKSVITGNIIDITDQRKLEAELFENQKMKSISTLAGGIAHDFNNLLGGILGYASLMLSEISEDHEFYNDIKEIADTTKKAAELTNHLLAFARGGRYKVKCIGINQLIKNITGILSHSPDNFIKFEFQSDDETELVMGDLQQIRQVIVNVCMNSIEASGQESIIKIHTKQVKFSKKSIVNGFTLIKGKYVKVSIEDFGRGMNEQTKTRMFEPFFSTKNSGTGIGLGLALVYGVIKNHGGALEVESTPGKGTKFSFYLPKAENENVKKEKLTKVHASSEGKIFIVDDEKVIRDVSKRVLEREGFKVISASNGTEALKLYRESWKEISIVILDLVMPDMSGEEVYKELCKINSRVKVIFASGYAPEDRSELKNFSYNTFIQKPFRPQELIEEVNKLTKSSHLF
ncbi:PAS domain S-box protein [bacterium]|nr:PAS domain S-box protein [bacterium]